MIRWDIDPPDDDRWDAETPCCTPTCEEPASPGTSFCNSCHVFNQELADIRRREMNDAIFTRCMRSDWKAS